MLIQPYTDPSGVTHPEAAWVGNFLNIDAASPIRRLTVVFHAYHDAAAFLAGFAPLAGGSKTYEILGAEFAGIAGQPPEGATLYDVLAHAAESYALAREDVKAGTEQVDLGDGEIGVRDVMVSFFADAIQV